MTYTVKQLARIAGVSVRTLHYYDEIGLLKPSFVQANGYRKYGEKELLSLQQILFFRELEFPLEEITKIIHARNFDAVDALLSQKKLLEIKETRIQNLLKTIDKTIQTLKGGESMSTDDLFASFDDAQMEQYKTEAKQRWGHTEAYKQSTERTKNWTKEEYKKIAEQGKIFTQKLADTMDKGSNSPEFQKLIEQQYKSIGTFYDCSLDMYRALGNMYVDDKRFIAYYEKFKPGLAVVMRDAIAYYCDEQKKLMDS